MVDSESGAGLNTPSRPITTGRRPVNIAVTPDGKTAYVANDGSDTVTPIQVATNTAIKPIITGSYPEAITIFP